MFLSLSDHILVGRPECDPDNHLWVIQPKQVGQPGIFGSIHEACCQKDCRYVAKILRYRPSSLFEDEITPEGVQAEIEIQNRLDGIAPKIHLAWIGETEGGMIMDALDVTLEDIWTEFRSLEVRRMVVEDLFHLLDRLHERQVVHLDFHWNNIMAKRRLDPEDAKLNELERYRRRNYRYFVIDLGRAVQIDEDDSAEDFRQWRIDDYLKLRDTLDIRGDAEESLFLLFQERMNEIDPLPEIE